MIDRSAHPSPLAFHLGAAVIAYHQATLAAAAAADSTFPWHPDLRQEADLLSPPDPLNVAQEAASRLQSTLAGMAKWQAHPYQRPVTDRPVIWTQGSSRLLDYGGTGRPVLVVPSLVNRAHILDLHPDRSFLGDLARRNLHPYLLDWGEPGFDEREFNLETYATDRLLPALAILRAISRSDVSLVGYCMGGTLAACLAARRPQGISDLVTIGAPWSFGHESGAIAGLRQTLRSGDINLDATLHALQSAFGLIPVDLFQMLFALLDPLQVAGKFRRFDAQPADSDTIFVALEDWLADGVCMAGPAARNLLIDWQLNNRLDAGQWSFLGGFPDPARITVRTLVVAGRRDTIAPPESADVLAAIIPRAALLAPQAGHVGMIMGSDAARQVWHPVADFLLQNRA